MADLQCAEGLKCQRVPKLEGGTLVLDCRLFRAPSSPGVSGLLANRLKSGIAAANARVSPAVTPFAWLNHTAFWWLTLPFLAALLAGHRCREDLRAGTWWLQRRPHVLVAWMLVLTGAARLRNMAYGHPFFSASPDWGGMCWPRSCSARFSRSSCFAGSSTAGSKAPDSRHAVTRSCCSSFGIPRNCSRCG